MVVRDPAAIAYAAASVVFAWVAVLAWRRRQHAPTVAVSLVVVMLGLGLSALADAVALASPDELVSAVASLAILPGVGIATGSFVCLGIAVARPQWVPARALVAALLVEPALVTVAAATNARHEWVFGGAGAADLTGSATWTYGPAFWWHTGYSYLALLIGVGLIAWGWWTAPPAFRRQRLAILLATLVPIAANVVYLARGLGQFVDPTPFGFAVTGVIMAHAIFRQDLVTLSPVALALVVDQIGDAVIVLSPAGRILNLNTAAVALIRAMSPAAPADLVGRPAEDLRDPVSAAGGCRAEIVVDLPGGPAEFQVRASPLVDRLNRSLGEVYVARDVTEANAQTRSLAAANARLVRQVETIEGLRADLVELASRDALTGLHNRRYLVDRFGPMIVSAERAGEPLAVVLLDIDRFKSINDHQGHLVGDEVLVVLARRIVARAPAGALVARWGGEEFFIALPGADAATGVAFADDVRRCCVRDGMSVGGSTISCTLSGGVATYPASGTTANELFHAADVALYAAKNAGRNVIRLHSDGGPSRRIDIDTDAGRGPVRDGALGQNP